MPVEEVDKVRAVVPDLYEGILKDLDKLSKETDGQTDKTNG